MTSELKKDFGLGNMALILSVAVVLFLLMNWQKPQESPQHVGGPLGLSISSDNSPKLDVNALAAASAPQTSNTPQVLGAATYDTNFVSSLNVQVQISGDDSVAAVRTYGQQFNILADTDKVTVGDAPSEIKFLTDIKHLAVPAAIADYQKLAVRYYELNYLKDSGQLGNNADQVIQTISEIKPQMDAASSIFNQRYLISLP